MNLRNADAEGSQGSSDKCPPAKGEAPQVSVVITCYNEAAYVGAAIDSVLAQTASAQIAEIIVVDDGSTDESLDVLDQIAASRPNVRVIRKSNGGLSAARNAGIALAKSEWIGFLDGDDLWKSEKLARQLEAAAHAQAADLIYTDFVEFDAKPEAGAPIKVRRFRAKQSDQLKTYFLYDGPIIPSTILVRRSAGERVGWFDPDVRLFEDMDFYLRFSEGGGRFQHVPGTLLYKRKRSNSLSAQASLWERAHFEIGRRSAARTSYLRRLLKRREAFRLAKIAEAHFRAGERSKGWAYLGRSLSRNMFGMRALTYAVFAMLPLRAAERLKLALRQLRANRMQSKSHRPINQSS